MSSRIYLSHAWRIWWISPIPFYFVFFHLYFSFFSFSIIRICRQFDSYESTSAIRNYPWSLTKLFLRGFPASLRVTFSLAAQSLPFSFPFQNVLNAVYPNHHLFTLLSSTLVIPALSPFLFFLPSPVQIPSFLIFYLFIIISQWIWSLLSGLIITIVVVLSSWNAKNCRLENEILSSSIYNFLQFDVSLLL